MRPLGGWLLGTTLFALGMILVDRLFWARCDGLPTSRYGEVWICSSVVVLHVASAVFAGLCAGLSAKRRGILVGALAGLAGLVAVSLTYRPPLAYNQLAAVAAGVALFVAPATLACAVGARLAGATWRRALL